MLKSMTAIGRSIEATPFGRFVIDIQSVNRRFLDIQFFLPKECIRFEWEMRKWIEAKVARGAITVRVEVDFAEGVGVIKPNLPLVRQLKAAWEEIYRELGLQESIDPELIASHENLMIVSEAVVEEENYLLILKKGVTQALDELIDRRIREGNILQKDLLARLSLLEGDIDFIASRASDAVNSYRKKLEEKVSQFTQSIDNDERILREIALFADRIDISEEIVRFKAHLQHFRLVMDKDSQAGNGKTLEFIIQELVREINTISSKNSDIEIANRAVRCKGELEKVREQIQNVE